MTASVLLNMNFLSVIIAASAYFVLGILWYSPKTLCSKWLQLNFLKTDSCRSKMQLFLIAFFSTLASSLLLAFFISIIKADTIINGIWISILTFLALMTLTVAVSFGLTEKRVRLQFSDAGYHLAGFMLMGMILSIWK
ncbi:MAG: DUF1761 domain-containing protein [Methanococcaceae archaeon]